jgi:large conductance mechanosensitive channel
MAEKNMSGFIEFIRKQGVVGLAVGFILGGAVSKLVSAVVSDVVNPLIGLALGSVDGLANASIKLGTAEILWGHLVAIFVDFIIVALVVYLLFKILGLEKLDKKE